MRHAVALSLMLFVVAACGDDAPSAPGAFGELADYGEAPQRLMLEGAEASVLPPAGLWRTRSSTPAPAQWHEELRREADGIVLRASVFPTQTGRDPTQVLPRVIDAFLRGRQTFGFGQTGRKVAMVWGVPMAWSQFAATVDGHRVDGHARLLLVDAAHWALAIGFAPTDAGPQAQALVASYVASLEPAAVTFYERVFARPEALSQVVVRHADEPPVTRADLAAVQLVLEAGTGVRFPLASAPALLDALAAEARQGTPAARASFRETAATLAETRELAPADRAAGMRALGQKILKAIFERVLSGYEPAKRYKAVWDALSRPLVGEGPSRASAAAVRSLVEMSAFLASVATNATVEPTTEVAEQLRADLVGRWAPLDPDARKDLAAAGTSWAALRYAWDHAEASDRGAFRRGVLAALAAPQLAVEVKALADDRALHTWLSAHAGAAEDTVLRAAALSATERTRLIGLLGVDGSGYHLGW